jgi:hypothetical protein
LFVDPLDPACIWLGGTPWVFEGRAERLLIASHALRRLRVCHPAVGGFDSDFGFDNNNGNGQGGGVYIDVGGTVSADQATAIHGNSVSTSDNDVFGTISPL